MTPRDQAIEGAHQAAVAEAWKLVTLRNGEWTLDGEKEKRVIATRGMFEEFLLFYSGARARLDGAKMMPRDATEEMVVAGGNAQTRSIGSWGEPGVCYRAMFAEFNKADHARDVPALPPDVVELVIAARIVAYEDQSPESLRDLDKAAEAFSERVPWEDDPEELRALTPKDGSR